MVNNKRLIELALAGLEVERLRIESEIVALRRQLASKNPAQASEVATNIKARSRNGGITAAGRKKISEMMKARWAAKRNENTKRLKSRAT